MTPVSTALSRHHRPIISGLAVLTLIAGVVLVCQVRTTRPPAPAPLPATPFSLSYRPSPAPTTTASDTGKPALSQKLSAHRVYIPSLDIDATWSREPIAEGSLVIPHDVHTIGLSADGGQPDSAAGTVLLASHVNYRDQGPGVFSALFRISPGALVILTDDASRPSTWRVSELSDPDKAHLDPRLFTSQGPRQLALVTCGGQIHNGEYDRNVVAIALPDEQTPALTHK